MNDTKMAKSVKLFLLAPLFLMLALLLTRPVSAQDTLDLDKAVKIGSGKVMVIEFTDPDCPYCRRAEAYFQGQPQVTRYIFFYPLSSHPDSKAKVQYILSSPDKAKAYLEVAAGKWDSSKAAAITPEGVKLQKEHMDIVKSNNVTATPTFMIYGRIVKGFNVQKLEPLLK